MGDERRHLPCLVKALQKEPWYRNQFLQVNEFFQWRDGNYKIYHENF